MAEIFDFEDFFLDPADPGIEVPVTLKARTPEGLVDRVVPLRIRKGVDLNGSAAASQRGVKVDYDLETGKPKNISIDEAEVAAATLAQLILSWPFTKQGKPVPINEKYIRMMFGDNIQAIVDQLNTFMGAKQKSLVPFENR